MTGGVLAKLKPHNCPRYPHCSAAICPLDLRWGQRVHFQDEEVCHLLRISQQPGKAETFFATYFESGFLDELHRLLPELLKRYPVMKKGLRVTKDRPLRVPYKPKTNRRPKGNPEQFEKQLQEYRLNASGGLASDLNEAVDTFSYPEEAIIE